MNNKLLILTYHLIRNSDKEKPSGYHPVFTIEKKALDEQLQTINSIIEGNSLRHSDSTKIEISFDDGFKSDYEIAFPLLEKNNLKARFFINLQNIKNDTRWNQYRELLKYGHSIGSHGMTHLSFLNLSHTDLKHQFGQSKKIIEDKTGVLCTDFSFPLGAYNSDVIKYGKEEGYADFYTTRCRLNKIENSKNILHRFQLKSNYDIKFFEKIIGGDPVTKIWLKSKADCSIALKRLFYSKY